MEAFAAKLWHRKPPPKDIFLSYRRPDRKKEERRRNTY
jgi:hypothetical protein